LISVYSWRLFFVLAAPSKASLTQKKYRCSININIWSTNAMTGHFPRAVIVFILFATPAFASASSTWNVTALGYSATSCSAQDAATKVVTDFVNSRAKYSDQPTAQNPSAVCTASSDGQSYSCQLNYQQRTWLYNSGEGPVFTDWQNASVSADALISPGDNQCGQNSCESKAGQSAGISNYSFGWSWGADGSDQVFPDTVNLTPSACVEGCAVTVVLGGCISHWISKAPSAQGLYRLSADCQAYHEGKSCVASDPKYSSGNPLSPPAACPGTFGEVNGKPVCLGSSAGTNPNKAQSKSGNPKAGSKSSDSSASREPSAAQGGGADARGGPGVTGGGTGSDSNDDSDDDPQKSQCELTPNAALCKDKVPIDETGTPSSTGSLFDSAIQQLDQAKESLLDLFPDAVSSDGKDTQWTFSFALPSSCQAIETPIGQTAVTSGFKLDVCKYQPLIHDLMAMVWISGTIWLLIGMFGNTLRAT
jgi:hypothetical protein